MTRTQQWLQAAALYAGAYLFVRLLWPFETLLTGVLLCAFVAGLAGIARFVWSGRGDRLSLVAAVFGAILMFIPLAGLVMSILPGASARVWGRSTRGVVSAVRLDRSKYLRSGYIVDFTFAVDSSTVSGRTRARATEVEGLRPGHPTEVRYLAALHGFHATLSSRGYRPLDVTAILVFALFPWITVARRE